MVTSRNSRPTIGWGRVVLGKSIVGVLLLCVGLGQGARAQSSPPDSQQQRPPEIDRIRQRIGEIRRTSSQWRRRLGTRLAPGAAAQSPSSPSEQRPLRLSQRQDGPTRADLRRVERRLQELIRQFLADEYRSGISAQEVAERFRFVPPDTARVATPIRDTITVMDTVRTAPDTVRQTRVEVVERRLLDTGVFRGYEVNFAFGESTLQPRATRTLNAVGEVLQRYPDLRIEIGGHTDAIGTDDFNQRLSDARAEAVRTYLLDRFGLSPERLVARGYGEAQPVASNDERSGRALNRRVEFRVLNPEAVQ